MPSTKVIAATAVAILGAPASAFWRMECRGVAGQARIDPLMSPGSVASHVHEVFGSSGKFDETLRSLQLSRPCRTKTDRPQLQALVRPSITTPSSRPTALRVLLLLTSRPTGPRFLTSRTTPLASGRLLPTPEECSRKSIQSSPVSSSLL